MNAYIDKSVQELRGIAEELGIEFPKNISKAKLTGLLIADDEAASGTTKVEGVKVTKEATPSEIRKEMDKLIRCKVSSSDPMYKGRNGVTMQVGNKLKVVGKFIPFNTIWHMQQPVYDSLMRKQWRETKFVTDKVTGNKIAKQTMHPSFNIELLPQLTVKELKNLAKDQSARGAIDQD